jgi:hypothetical protein
MKEPAIVGVCIAGLVTVAGWLVTYNLNMRAAREADIRKAALQHLEAQLEKLYGPLAFLVIEGQQEFRDLLENLGRSYVFEAEKPLPEDELATWLFWTEHAFLPRNEAIKNLLMANTHLMVGSQLPKSYRAFLDHCNSWRINHLRWKEQQVPYSFHSKANWPSEFETDVLRTFGELKNKHEKLLRDIGAWISDVAGKRKRDAP